MATILTATIGTTKLNKHAVCLSSEGEVSLEMEKILGQNPEIDGRLKANKVLEINITHKVFEKLKNLDGEDFENMCYVLFNLATLMAGLEVDNVTKLADNIFELM